MQKLEEFLKRRQKRKARIEDKKISLGVIKDALIAYLQPFNSDSVRNEIIDVDIKGLTTDLVDVKIYIKEV